MVKAVVLAEGCLGEDLGKTANGLVLHSMRDEIVAAIDSTKAGRDAGEVISGKKNGVPVVGTFEEAFQRFKPQALYLGAATVGGFLPQWFTDTTKKALGKGLIVYNGLHKFLSEDPEFAGLAKNNGARIVDVRKPPENLRVADGRVYDVKVPRVLVMGTDCSVGKRMTVVELVKEARKRGINAGFVATGQTGCMIGPDAGAVIDRIPSDFCAGQVEQMICDVAAAGREIIFIYGQASLFHPAYSGVSLSILHGAAPHAVVLQTDPVRKHRVMFKNPAYKIADLRTEIKTIETLGTGKVVAIAINGKDCGDIDEETRHINRLTGLPAVDPLQRSPALLLEAVLEYLERTGAYARKATTA